MEKSKVKNLYTLHKIATALEMLQFTPSEGDLNEEEQQTLDNAKLSLMSIITGQNYHVEHKMSGFMMLVKTE